MSGSVYERRELTWRDRLRQLVGREKPPAPPCDPPVWVVGTGAEQGRVIGLRCEDGSVLRIPEEPTPLDEPADAAIYVAGMPWRGRSR